MFNWSALLANPQAASYITAALLIAGFGAVTTLLLQVAWNRSERAQKRDAYSRRLLSALDDGPPWLLFLDAAGRIIQTNRVFAAAFDAEAKQLGGQDATAVLGRYGADPALLVRFDAARRAGQGFRLPLQLKQQHWLLIGQPWQGAINKFTGGNGYWLLGVEMTGEAAATAQLQRLAYHDGTTGLPNRSWLVQSANAQPPRTVAQIAFPRLAQLQTTLGPAAAEQFMVASAQRLRAELTPTQAAARLDHTSFALLDSAATAAETMRALADTLSEPLTLDGHEARLLPAIGIVTLPETSKQPDIELVLADATLAAQSLQSRAARAQIALYDPALRTKQQQRQALAADLRRAIYFEPEQFVACYQPIRRLGDGGIVGAALQPHWHHPVRGTVAAELWLPLADELGLATALWVQLFAAGCRALKRWHWRAPDLFLSVAASARQLPALQRTAEVVLELTGIAAQAIRLEVTETRLLDLPLAAQQQQLAPLFALRARGFRLSAEEFGTTLTRLADLHRLPLTDVTLEPTLVRDLHSGAAPRELAAALARLGNALGHTVTAAAVTSAADVELLRGFGCQLGYGALWGPPLSADRFSALIVDLSAGAPPAAQSVPGAMSS